MDEAANALYIHVRAAFRLIFLLPATGIRDVYLCKFAHD